MNNAKCDCRNNIDNCKFTALFHEIEKVSCIQKYVLLFFNEVNKDFACQTTKEQIEQEQNRELMKIDPEDPCGEQKNIPLVKNVPLKLTLQTLWLLKKQNKTKKKNIYRL